MKNILIVIIAFFYLAACSYKPILDQNQKFVQTPADEREAAIDKCMKDGDTYLKQYKAQRALKEAGRTAVIGSVVGAISGLLFGHTISSTLTSTVVGAGIGGAVGGLSVAGEGSVTPDQIKQNYVGNCLARQGYAIIGWQ